MKDVRKIAESLTEVFTMIDSKKEELMEETIEINEIAAPPFLEEVRGNFLEKKFKEIGLKVERDEIGNVIGKLSDDNVRQLDLPPVMIAAHIDTVFGEDVDVKVKRVGNKLFGPGVSDDVRGLVNILELARIFQSMKVERGIYFIANVGEEGLGDLRGTKHLFNAEEHRDKFPIHCFLTIDGSGNSNIVQQSIGSKRYRVHFRGDGGHSYGAFGLANPGFALGNFLHYMSNIKVPSEPKTTYSVGIISGGTSINSIPFHVYAEIDLRSEDTNELDTLVMKIKRIADTAVNDVKDKSTGKLSFEFEEIGNRPAGSIHKEAYLCKLAIEVNNYFGIETNFTASSTDANIPHSLGIPAICISGNDVAGRAHSLDEWVDAGESSLITLKRNLLLLSTLVL